MFESLSTVSRGCDGRVGEVIPQLCVQSCDSQALSQGWDDTCASGLTAEGRTQTQSGRCR